MPFVLETASTPVGPKSVQWSNAGFVSQGYLKSRTELWSEVWGVLKAIAAGNGGVLPIFDTGAGQVLR